MNEELIRILTILENIKLSEEDKKYLIKYLSDENLYSESFSIKEDRCSQCGKLF